jgi:aspartyl-tRNA(Asn)/glutamyl-tRNA(Gln) amidotransferase subunit C
MTQRISLDDVRGVANLARLDLDEHELRAMQGQLDSILDWMATLDQLDLTDVPPTYHAIEMRCPLRDDVPRASLRREEVLPAAARSEAGAFAVPKVMEGE